MSGLEFARHVKSNPSYKFIPIVMLSGEGKDENISKAKEAGVSTFLNKPPKEAQLKTLLQITLNKRRGPRIAVRLDVCYGKDGNRASYNPAHTHNMSIGGLFLETDQPLSPGEQLALEFVLPGSSFQICCQGRVAWINCPVSPVIEDHPSGMGIEFLDLKDERVIQEFLKTVN